MPEPGHPGFARSDFDLASLINLQAGTTASLSDEIREIHLWAAANLNAAGGAERRVLDTVEVNSLGERDAYAPLGWHFPRGRQASTAG